MKTALFVILTFLPICVLGQVYHLKDGEMSLNVENLISSDGKHGLFITIQSVRSMKDSLFQCEIGPKGDTIIEYLPDAKGEKMYMYALEAFGNVFSH